MEKLEHRLIGVSDGFDLDSKSSQVMLMAIAMLNEMFIAGLRDKVLRGMKAAAERGTSLGLPLFGYKLVDKLDEKGQPIITAKGTHLKIPAIDEDKIGHVIQAAKWFADDKVPYREIARRFNASKVDGKANWYGNHISKLLANPMYAGTRIYNRTRTVWDKETGEFTRKLNPESEWVIKEMPELRIIEEPLWQRLRARAEEVAANSPRTGKKLSSRGTSMPECEINALYPTSIVDGVLFCNCCGRAMRLIRSGADSMQYVCPNGNDKVHGCTFRSSKSLNQITAGLMPHIREQVLTEDKIAELVSAANAYLAEEAAKPRQDLSSLRRTLLETLEEEQRLVALVAKHGDDHDMTSFLNRTDELAISSPTPCCESSSTTCGHR